MANMNFRTPAKAVTALYHGENDPNPIASILIPSRFATDLIDDEDEPTRVPNNTTRAKINRPKTSSSALRPASASGAATHHFQPLLPPPGSLVVNDTADDESNGESKRKRRWPAATRLANNKLAIDQTKSRLHISKKRSDWPKEMLGSNSIDPDKLDPSIPITQAEVAKVHQCIAEYEAAARDAATRGDLTTARAAKSNAGAISKCLETASRARFTANKKRVITKGEYWIPQEDLPEAYADPELFVGMELAESIRNEYPFLKCQGWDELDYDDFGKLMFVREERTLGQLEMYAKILENRALFMVGGTSMNCQSLVIAADDRADEFP